MFRGYPEWHIKQDVIPLLDGKCKFVTMDGTNHSIDSAWDMIIAFPPCTHIALSGAKHFEKKRLDGRQREGIEFFCKFLDVDCKKVAIENPMGIMSGGKYLLTYYPDLAAKYNVPTPETQRVHPWMFGDPYEKTTCLWLKGLPELQPTNPVEPEPRHVTSSGRSLPAWYSNSSLRMSGNRKIVRSKTFQGIARAMATQWTQLQQHSPE